MWPQLLAGTGGEGRSVSRPAAERIRELAEAEARRRFPDAELVRCNPHHRGGPVVEVRRAGAKVTQVYAFTGYEL